VLNYAGIFAVFAIVLSFTGATRLFWGMVPPLVLVSLLLWYPFAVQTHEGFSTGTMHLRSHNYYGRFMYWVLARSLDASCPSPETQLVVGRVEGFRRACAGRIIEVVAAA